MFISQSDIDSATRGSRNSNACARYWNLSAGEKKRLELDEDRLLGSLLFNLVGFMTMMQAGGVPGWLEESRRKVRRLLARCHIGLQSSQEIHDILDNLDKLVRLSNW